MKPRPPSAFDSAVGWLAWGVWRGVGLLLWPVLLLLPAARRHLWRVPHPVPGWAWLHGASLGEHQAVAALASVWPDTRIWRTSSSPRTPVPGAFPAPADLPFVVGPWLNLARPSRLVLVESELWPGWLVACKTRGIPVTVVQARPSRGWRRWARLGPVWRWLMADVTVVPQAEVGDLKQAAPSRPVDRPLPPGAIVLASGRDGDEARVLAAWLRLPRPRPLLVLAPRHPRRCPAVAAHAAAAGLSVSRRSAGTPPAEVHLIDTVGELAELLPGAAAVVVGGTWDPVLGGHSPGDAVRAGAVVVAGPHRSANPEAWAQARAIPSDGTPDDLASALAAALRSPRPSPPPPTAAPHRTLARLPPPAVVAPRSTRPLLWPFVPLVHGIGRLRPAWHARPVRVSVPVVSVGGLTAGGTGKTPLSGWLAAHIPGAWVVARGHRRGAGPAVRLGMPGAPPRHPLGDELEMLRRRGIPVVSAPDRVAGARAAIAAGARCIVLDDGFQHRRLHRDVDVVSVDPAWPLGGGPIPVGTGREPWSALARAHLVVLYGPGDLPFAVPPPTVRAHLELGPAPDGTEAGTPPDRAQLPAELDLAVGLARPAHLLCHLVERGHTLRSCRLVGDHHDLGRLPPGCVVTEKDAARLEPAADVRVLRARLVVESPAVVADVLAAHGIGLLLPPPSSEE